MKETRQKGLLRLLSLALVGGVVATSLAQAPKPGAKNEPAAAKGSTPAKGNEGIVQVESRGTVLGTGSRIEAELKAQGFVVATRTNLVEPKVYQVKGGGVRLIVFRSKGDTEALKADPLRALSLPNEILVYEDAQGKVFIAYEDPQHTSRGPRAQSPEAKTLAEKLTAVVQAVTTKGSK